MHSPSVWISVKYLSTKGLTEFASTVKYVPDWFPGAGFKTFARIAKKDIDDSITPPFRYVKKSFEVCEPPLLLLVLVSYWDELQAETLTTPSIVATCLEELPELAKQGVDEEVIRGVCGSVYLGEHHGHIPGRMLLRSSSRI